MAVKENIERSYNMNLKYLKFAIDNVEGVLYNILDR